MHYFSAIVYGRRCNMNYMRELNAFRDWAMINSPSTGVVALWHMLMSVNNMTGWIEWFTVPNSTLQLLTGLFRQGIDSTRNALVQKGLIEYKKGISNQAGKYRIVSFFKDSPVDKNLECKNLGTELGTPIGTVVGTLAAEEQAHLQRGASTLYIRRLEENKNINNSAHAENGVDNSICTLCGGQGWYVGKVPFNNGIVERDSVVQCECKKRKPSWANRIEGAV